LLSHENIYSAFFTYAILFTLVMYLGNLKKAYRLICNYAVFVIILVYMGNSVAYTLDYSKVNFGDLVQFKIINVRGLFILGIHLFMLGYAYLLVINFINNYHYSYFPRVFNWSPRLINKAAIARNKA
jgi:hypothetical protein